MTWKSLDPAERGPEPERDDEKEEATETTTLPAGAREVLEGGRDWFVAQANCVELMRLLPENSVDAIVCDPPYFLGFMAAAWDGAAYDFDYYGFSKSWAKEAIRVLKPGGHLLSFSGTRTYHRMVCGIEDAGFAIRDLIHYCFGTGFPKGKNIGLEIDRIKGVAEQRGVLELDPNNPVSEEAKKWQGWNSQMKPAHEPICCARKPPEGTIAENVLKWGTGGVNTGGTRVGTAPVKTYGQRGGEGRSLNWKGFVGGGFVGGENAGRHPANLILTHHPQCREREPDEWDCVKGCPVRELDEQSGWTKSRASTAHRAEPNFKNKVYGAGMGGTVSAGNQHEDEGGASRYFHCFAWDAEIDFPTMLYYAKPTAEERDAGCEKLAKSGDTGVGALRDGGRGKTAANDHTTVKPWRLMAHLCKLVTPPGGLVLDPFCGSGSTGIGALKENFRFLGVELDSHYCDIARARIGALPKKLERFG